MNPQNAIVQQPGLRPQEVHLQPSAITIQPGGQVQPAPGSVWMPLPPTIYGVPIGLEYLTLLDMVQIHQMIEPLQFFFNWEMQNKYVLKNANGQQCYYAFEESDGCERYLCGPNRGFVIHIVDNFKREVLTIRRDTKCFAGGCCACSEECQNECTIETPSMGVLGTIKQTPGCITTYLNIHDADGRVVFQVDGPDCCVLIGCGDKEFLIRSANTSAEVGTITKKWGGFLRETFTKADTFFVGFPQNLDVKLKAVLLGATFLIDFMVFEMQRNNTYY